jgi:glycosyltransferase involved in cell wall biosynthesis
MKVLLVHNFYGSSAPSGENQVFEAENAMLLKYGHKVGSFTRHSDYLIRSKFIGAIRGASSAIWNPFVNSSLSSKINEFKPDIIHVHNTFPSISPGIFHAIDNKIPVVLTLHNYRLFCPAAIPFRQGRVCTDCLNRRSVIPSIKHGCYRDSRIATLPVAASVAAHRALGTWNDKVDAFIVLSEFQRELMVSGGLNESKIYVKPNFCPGPDGGTVVPVQERSPQVVFVGRLSKEKGVHTLVHAWHLWGADAPLLRIIGDGPLSVELRRMSNGLPIEFLGQVSSDIVKHEIASSRLLILPSETFETFGLVIIEAFAVGTPVVVSNIGPLSSIVDNGINGAFFNVSDSVSLLSAIKNLIHKPSLLDEMSRSAHQTYKDLYSEDANYNKLMMIYNDVINRIC